MQKDIEKSIEDYKEINEKLPKKIETHIIESIPKHLKNHMQKQLKIVKNTVPLVKL